MFTVLSRRKHSFFFHMNDPEAYDLTRNVHRITLYSTVSAEQQHPSNLKKRLYLHVDMNCFYAQVEQQCYNLFGIPIIVGGWRKENGTPRGIVATSSYEARKCGIKTGMSFFEATQLCPYVAPMQVHYTKYIAISREIKRIFLRFSPETEAYSMDESFLDLTYMVGKPRAELEQLGIELRNAIYNQCTLLCSIGISYSKTYAKLASDLKKPNGLTLVLDKEEAAEKLYPLSLNEVWGIGSKRFQKLKDAEVHTIQDAVDQGMGKFQKLFGAYFGRMLWETATGKDCAKVAEPKDHVPKEVGYMHTFSDWTNDPDRVQGEMTKAVRQLCYRMRGYNRRAEMFHGYIRFQDNTWTGVGFDFRTPGPTNLDIYILSSCIQSGMPAVRRFLAEGHRIRGIGLNTLKLEDDSQLQLFFTEHEKFRNLFYAVDKINNRYGLDTIMQASLKYDVKGKTHFLERS